MNNELKQLLTSLAEQYETEDFLCGDPSWWMHQVDGAENQEATAFVASSLSYGSRKQFMPKIESLVVLANGDMDDWLRCRKYTATFRPDDMSAFYRLYSHAAMYRFFEAYSLLLQKHGTLGSYVRNTAAANGHADAKTAIDSICRWFSNNGDSKVIPHDSTSACKRLCMFLRWMVRDNSPVDLGLWSSFMDRSKLIMPLDTHVVQEACRLKLADSPTTSMSAAQRLTNTLADCFPNDPLRADFALFGMGVEGISAEELVKK